MLLKFSASVSASCYLFCRSKARVFVDEGMKVYIKDILEDKWEK